MLFGWKSEARRLLEARISELLEERVVMRADHAALVDALREERDEARREFAGLADRVLARQGYGKPVPSLGEEKDPDAPKPLMPAYETLADTQKRVSAAERDGMISIVDGKLVIGT